MRLGHVYTPQGPRAFVERDGERLLVGDVLPGAPRTLDALIRDPGDWLSRLAAATEEGGSDADPSLRTAPALLSPSAIVAIGLNYLDHCRELGTAPPSSPIVFAKLPTALCGDGDEIRWRPEVTSGVDWEAELGVVIGRSARDVPEEAAEMIFPVAALVSYLSRSFTLRPGDVIATGTPLGVGGFRSPPVFLRDGDVVEVEVEGIGVLRNTCRELAADHD